jgi:opacity protein-like surface antigen
MEGFFRKRSASRGRKGLQRGLALGLFLSVVLFRPAELRAGGYSGIYEGMNPAAEAFGPNTPPGNARGFFTEIFGGVGGSTNGTIVQSGTAFLNPPLNVQATGSADPHAAYLAGGGIGYEWEGFRLGNNPKWALLPAVEFEGYYLGTRQSGLLNNPTPRIPEHLFDFNTSVNIGVLSSDLLLTLHTPYHIHPYIGGGLGPAIISNNGATSIQLAPAEPGINHFNSSPNASAWSLAVTSRAGLRWDIGHSWYLFAEYKFLFINATDFTFGSTVYPTHPETTPWTVHYSGLFNHTAAVGIGFRF